MRAEKKRSRGAIFWLPLVQIDKDGSKRLNSSGGLGLHGIMASILKELEWMMSHMLETLQ